MRVTKGCPICEGDVLGTTETDYYCRRCNLLFTRRHIVFRHMRLEARRLINKHFSGYEDVPKEERIAEERVDVFAAPAARTRFEGVPERIEAAARAFAAARPSVAAAAAAAAQAARKTATRRKTPVKPARKKPKETKKTVKRKTKKTVRKKATKATGRKPAKRKAARKTSKGKAKKTSAKGTRRRVSTRRKKKGL